MFRQPDHVAQDFARVGQWHVRGGEIEFDEVEVRPVLAAHRLVRLPGHQKVELGEGEWLAGDRYYFSAQPGERGANFHRPLVRATTGFYTGRWGFTSGAELVYRFALAGPGAAQRKADPRAGQPRSGHARGRSRS